MGSDYGRSLGVKSDCLFVNCFVVNILGTYPFGCSFNIYTDLCTTIRSHLDGQGT